MPNPTFFNLPAEKRKRLMDAVWQEFTATSYMDASINKIIQAAGISRGSFYQYFCGKQDVFAYILHIILDGIKSRFSAQLTVHNNDLFAAILGMYDLILWKNTRGRRDSCLEQLHTLIQLNTELDMTQFTGKLDHDKMAKNFSALLALSGYEAVSPEEAHALIHMLAAVSMSNLSDAMRRPQNEHHNRQLLERQLELLRRCLTPLEPSV